MAKQFNKVATSTNDHVEGITLDIESEITDNVSATEPKSVRSHYCQKPMIKVFILLFIGTYVLCVIFIIWFIKENETTAVKKMYDTCDNISCCQYKENNLNSNIDCTSLDIQQCTLNDDICLWECDTFTPKHRRRSFKNYKFMKFDDGIGTFREFEFNGNNITTADYNKSETIEDIINKSTLYQVSNCGDVYKIELDPEIAELRLNDLLSSGTSRGSPVNNDSNHRRLRVFGDDTRTQITASDSFSKRIAMIVVNENPYDHCTGTLISKKSIITAAHCVYDTIANSWTHLIHIYLDRIGTATGTDYSWSHLTVPTRFIDIPPIGPYGDFEPLINTDWAVITLSTADTTNGWSSFGHDSSITADPSPTFVMRSHPEMADPYEPSMWIQTTTIDEAKPELFKSLTMDTNGGSSGTGLARWDSNGQVIFGVHSSSLGQTGNFCHRLDQVTYNTICDIVDDHTDAVC